MYESISVICVLAALAFVSTLDAKEAYVQEAKYKTMVCEGAWADYKKIEPDCTIKPIGPFAY